MCPKCESNLVKSTVVDQSDNQVIVHFICEQCGMEWVE